MSPILAAALFAMFLWWFATGAIFYLVGRSARAHRRSLFAASGVALAALAAIFLTRHDTGQAAAYIGFTAAVMLWGWHELTFLTGVLTGPRRAPCPAGCGGWRHFRHGVEALLYHEAAILLTAGLLAVMTWGAGASTALWTFALLWGMRISAKLNLHLGVPNTAAELLPGHLRYMKSFFSVRAINPLFPVSIALTAALTVWLAMAADAAPAGSGLETAYALMATLSGLALIEHWAMVLPMPIEALWRWSLNGREDVANDTHDDTNQRTGMPANPPTQPPIRRQTTASPGFELAAPPPFRAARGKTVKGG